MDGGVRTFVLIFLDHSPSVRKRKGKCVPLCYLMGDAHEFSSICYGVIVVAISSCHHHHCGCHEQHHHCHDHPEIVINVVVLDIYNGYNGVVVSLLLLLVLC